MIHIMDGMQSKTETGVPYKWKWNNGNYLVDFLYQGKNYNITMDINDDLVSRKGYFDIAAGWEVEDKIKQIELEALNGQYIRFKA